MSELRVYLLGTPRIEWNGRLVAVDTRKAVALLAFLCLSREDHGRETLAALLWPESDPVRARAALRRTLSALRKAIPPDVLAVTRETVGLASPDALWLDVDRFHSLLEAARNHGHAAGEPCPECLARLEEAVGLYRGDFLEGFTLRDSAAFDEWQFFHTDQFRQELSSALEKLAHGHALAARYDQALAHGRRWLALDPLREEAHRSLMTLYGWSGQRTAALRQYRECLRILEHELGVPPLEETTALYEAIKEGHLPAPPATAPVTDWAALRRPPEGEALPRRPVLPLVGRERQWQTLLSTYARVGASGQFLALEGEAGIGKTRLAEELLAEVQGRGGKALSARCYEGEGHLAYGPFVESLRAGLHRQAGNGLLEQVSDRWLGEAARLLPEVLDLVLSPPPILTSEGPGAQARFFEALSQLILALLSGSQPGVLFLDDVHYADVASLELLAYLARRMRNLPICLVVAWRSEELPADHPLRQVLGEAARAGTGRLLTLDRWDREDLRRLLEAAGLESPSEQLEARLFRETEGLPFFVVEYLALLQADPSAWSQPDWEPPQSVRDLLQSHLVGLDQAARQLLTTAAVIGRSFDYEVLRAASGRSPDETVTGLERLIGRGLIRELASEAGASPVYDFSHELLRRHVYAQASLARRRLLHRRVAEALLARLGRQPAGALAGQVAGHFQRAGEEARAADYFVQAGEYARSLFANREALAHYQAALALDHPQPAALHEAIGDLETLLGEYHQALASYETAAALGEPEDLPRREHRLALVYHRLGSWDLAESHFQAAMSALPEDADPGLQARLWADWSLTAHRQGEGEQALRRARQALVLAEQAQDARALAQVHNILGILARSAGDLEAACRQLADSLALAEELGDPGIRVAALNNLALAKQTEGELEEALELLMTALQVCVSQGDRHRAAALHNNIADLLHAMGRSEEALTHLRQAVTIFSDIGVQSGDWQPEIWKLVEW